MSGEEIEVTISDEGIVFEATGFHGKTCTDELEKFVKGLKAMGIESEVIKQEKKQAYYEQRSNTRLESRRN